MHIEPGIPEIDHEDAEHYYPGSRAGTDIDTEDTVGEEMTIQVVQHRIVSVGKNTTEVVEKGDIWIHTLKGEHTSLTYPYRDKLVHQIEIYKDYITFLQQLLESCDEVNP